MKTIFKQLRFFLAGSVLCSLMMVLSYTSAQAAGEIERGKGSNEFSSLSNGHDDISAADRSLYQAGGAVRNLGFSPAVEMDMALIPKAESSQELGRKLKELSRLVYEHIVIGESPETLSGFVPVDEKAGAAAQGDTFDLGLSLTSAYINDQLMEGMQLEFHANPISGGGAILIRKMF